MHADEGFSKMNCITFYIGILTPKDVSEIVSTPPGFKKEYLAGIGYTRQLFVIYDAFALEIEIQYVRHYGSQFFNEYVAALNVRYPLIVEKNIKITSSIGDGISYTSQILNHEHRRGRKSTHYINYLCIECVVSVVIFPVDIVLRLHHRSSAYGLILDGNTDSNFYCFGLRSGF